MKLNFVQGYMSRHIAHAQRQLSMFLRVLEVSNLEKRYR